MDKIARVSSSNAPRVVVDRNGRNRQVMGLADFTDDDITAIEKTKAPKVAAIFNNEIES